MTSGHISEIVLFVAAASTIAASSSCAGNWLQGTNSIDDIPSCNPHFGLGGSGDLRRVALLTFLLNAHRRKLSPAYEEPRRLPGSGGGGGGGEMKRNEKERCTRKRKRRRRRRTNRAAKRMMKKYYHRMHTSIRFFGK